jgi:hypothetical protein
MVMAARAELTVPSLVVKVKEPRTGLQTFAVGVKLIVAESVFGLPGVHGLLVIAPSEPLLAGPVANVSSQVSASEPLRVTTSGVSSRVLTAWTWRSYVVDAGDRHGPWRQETSPLRRWWCR